MPCQHERRVGNGGEVHPLVPVQQLAPEPCEERHLFLCQIQPQGTCALSQGSEFFVGHTRSWPSSPSSRMCSRTTWRGAAMMNASNTLTIASAAPASPITGIQAG